MNISEFTNIDNDFDINYLISVRSDKGYNINYIRDDKILVIRNHAIDGDVVDLKKVNEYVPWIMLNVKQFQCKDTQRLYDVPICTMCSQDLDSLEKLQNIKLLASKLCSHARVSSHIIKDYACPSTLENWLFLSEDFDEKGQKVEFIHKRTCKTSRSQHLAIVYLKDKTPTLVYTRGRQLTPRCSSCQHPRCGCVQYWEKIFNSAPTSAEKDDDNDENMDVKLDHYQKRIYGVYGYNTSKIKLPIKDCPIQKAIFDSRNQRYNLPEDLYPDYKDDLVCKHGNHFSDRFKLKSNCAFVYHEMGESVINCRIFSRKSAGGCRCEQMPDGHNFLLFYVGGGKFWDYITLQKFVLLYVKDGITAQGFYKNIKSSFEANVDDVSFSCDYQSFLKASDGFVMNIEWNVEKIFSCPNCGVSPKYLTGDGKCDLAPLQKKLEVLNIKEFSKHPSDNIILEQGTKHCDRVFLSKKKERDLVSSFLTSDCSESEIKKFLDTNVNDKSEEFLIIFNIVKKFENKTLPLCYIKLLSECSKNIAVAGILQVTKRNTLKYLREFCLKNINIRAVENEKYLQQLRSEIPAIWPLLLSIMNVENTTYLPLSVARLILSLLRKRSDTFKNASTRYSDEYFPYDQQFDPPTQYYPLHPLINYPKLYSVNNQTDKDGCQKNFSSHTKFCDGIFSIGCSCDLAITYGFELMLSSESPRHFFNFLNLRKLNFKELDGVLYDFSCGLHRYTLNREPAQAETLLFLVDGSHWSSKKKDKRGGGGAGHLGCSNSYNFNVYKPFVSSAQNGAKNSQGREQMHSILTKLSKSLRQKSYHCFMNYMITFFAINNLNKMGKI